MTNIEQQKQKLQSILPKQVFGTLSDYVLEATYNSSKDFVDFNSKVLRPQRFIVFWFAHLWNEIEKQNELNKQKDKFYKDIYKKVCNDIDFKLLDNSSSQELENELSLIIMNAIKLTEKEIKSAGTK